MLLGVVAVGAEGAVARALFEVLWKRARGRLGVRLARVVDGSCRRGDTVSKTSEKLASGEMTYKELSEDQGT